MIILEQNSVNNVYLTLSESVTLTATPVYYLFRFLDETTNDEVIFTTTDISPNIVRYNQFAVTLTGATSPNLDYSTGVIYLSPYGKWKYEVYEQLSSTNIFLSGATGPIEYGFVTVNAPTTTNTDAVIAEYTGSTDTYFYYQPGQ